MYCKNCGQTIDPNAAVCIHCGAAVNTGNRFCANCGREATPGANVCTGCGYAFAPPPTAKSKLAAGLLGILLGAFGVHNFYMGFTGKAVAQLLITVLSCGILSPVSAIWGLVEGIMILTSPDPRDAAGQPMRD